MNAMETGEKPQKIERPPVATPIRQKERLPNYIYPEITCHTREDSQESKKPSSLIANGRPSSKSQKSERSKPDSVNLKDILQRVDTFQSTPKENMENLRKRTSIDREDNRKRQFTLRRSGLERKLPSSKRATFDSEPQGRGEQDKASSTTFFRKVFFVVQRQQLSNAFQCTVGRERVLGGRARCGRVERVLGEGGLWEKSKAKRDSEDLERG